jgi:hypothetical protein
LTGIFQFTTFFQRRRAVAFGEVYIPKRDELQATLSKQTVTQLILQHLQYEGRKKTSLSK